MPPRDRLLNPEATGAARSLLYSDKGGPMSNPTSPELEAKWRSLLLEGHTLRWLHAFFRHMPSEPRCKLCYNPFGGVGGKVVGLFGFSPSPKNPNVCSACCDRLPPGGAEIDIAVLFADVRGSTRLAERMTAKEFAELMNRFYLAATRALVKHDAIIDKLIGDEVMALFIPGIAGKQYRCRAARAATDLLEAFGYGSESEPWLDVGVGVHAGPAYVGNVGADGMVDLTALGDAVNTAARLQGLAKGGEAVLGESVYAEVRDRHPDLPRQEVTVTGKTEPLAIRTLRLT